MQPITTSEQQAKSQFFDITQKVILGGGASEAAGAVAQPERQLHPGTIVDAKYKIITSLGSGGMGVVYKAQHLALGREVALKTLLSSNVSEDSWKRFQREAQALGRLNHKNIVQVFDFGLSENNIPFYTMECLNGQSLADRVGRRQSLADMLVVFLQASEAMSVAHKKGIIHRDIKPANIFLATDPDSYSPVETVKIVDFGVAGLASDALENQRLTSTGIIFGSPLYMSPEQARGDQVGPQSDIYSFGCTMFEMFTGDPPFKGDHAFATLYMHQSEPAPLLSEFFYEKQLPQRLVGLMNSMLAKDAAKRPASFDIVSQQLREIIAIISAGGEEILTVERGDDTKYGESEGDDDGESSKSKFAPVAIAGTIAALLLIGGGASYLFWQHQQSTKASTKTESATEHVANHKIAAFNNGEDGFGKAQDEKEINKQLQSNIASAKNLYVDPPVEGTPEMSTQPYRQKDRGNMMVYKFPPMSLGSLFIWQYDIHSFKQARGEIEVPRGAGLQLECSRNVYNWPRLMLNFGPRDLQSVVFSKSYPFKDEHIKSIAHMTSLPVLEIDSTEVTDGCIAYIDKIVALKSLKLQNTKITGAKLATIRNLPFLNYLMVTKMDKMRPVLEALPVLKNQFPGQVGLANMSLSVCEMVNCNVDDADIKVLTRMRNLNKLNIAENDDLTNASMAELARFPNLERLNISNTGINSQAAPLLGKFPKLKLLVIDRVNWNEEAVKKAEKDNPGLEIITNGKLMMSPPDRF